VTPHSTFTCHGEERVANTRIRCLRRSGHGRLTVAQGIAQSCNLVLAKVAVKTGATAYDLYGRLFGFNEPLPDFPLPVAASRIPPLDRLNGPMLAECGFGQGALTITPLQMALVTAAIANGGKIMRPYLVQEIRSRDGEKLFEHQPEVWKEAVSSRTSAQVSIMMQAVMKPGGTAPQLRLPGVTLAGKTGTAQNPHGRTHAWFVAFAPAGEPRVAVAVIVENGGVGGRVAGPIALAAIKAGL
jgi:peptidoglycan glycosyltransferase